MKFVGIAPIQQSADPLTGQVPGETELFRRVVATAVLFEELGFDGFAIGERHHVPFLATSPAVVLSHIAALTSRIRLFTGVALLSLHDPVRFAEEYATLDHLSGGRLEVIIGKGAGPQQAELFGLTPDRQREALQEKYRLLHRLWTERDVTWRGSVRPPLAYATTFPRPLQQPPRIWHGSATSLESVDLAAEYGDPLVFSNASSSTASYAWLIEHYRKRWAEFGRDPAALYTGAGTPAFYCARTSQQALADFRPIHDARRRLLQDLGRPPEFPTLEDFVERSPALIGSPQQIIEKVHAQHEILGHTLLCFSVEPDGLEPARQRESFELFQSDVAPELRRTIPDPPWPAAAG